MSKEFGDAIADADFAAFQVDVFDAQSRAFE
jgi:hypothetical protein